MTALGIGIVLVLAAPTDPDADKFAAAVREVHQTLEAKSIVRPSPSRLAKLSLRGLYKAHGQELPDDLCERLKNEKATGAELRALLRDGYRCLAAHHEMTVETAVDDAILFTLKAIDPHASWQTSDFSCELTTIGLAGVGVELRLDAKTGMPTVVTPIKDGPAYRAGVRAGDIITHVTPLRDCEVNPDIEENPQATAGAGLPQVYRWLLGPADSRVVLTVRRAGVKEPLPLYMRCGGVRIDTVHGWRRKDDDSWDFQLDKEKKIGYLRIRQFGVGTPEELENALKEMEAQGARGVILDLRFCEGGLLGQMIQASALFLDTGDLVTKVQYREYPSDEYFCKDSKRRKDMKVVCLINGQTASAAELFAAALQDHQRAVIVGQRSCGKGSVQRVESINDHDLTFTMAVLLRPNGKKLARIELSGRDADEWGVVPDVANVVQLEPKEQDALKEYLDQQRIIPRRDVPVKEPPAFKDRQLQRALDVLRQR